MTADRFRFRLSRWRSDGCFLVWLGILIGVLSLLCSSSVLEELVGLAIFCVLFDVCIYVGFAVCTRHRC